MSKETGGAAFPRSISKNPYNGETVWDSEGMTLRDYFAAKAMQSLLISGPELTYKETAERAYIMADAMIEERDK